jgi:hypothetical protein
MPYIKSVLVGIATALITVVISTIVWMLIGAHQLHRQFPQAEISFDLRAMLTHPSIVWLLGPLAFIAGFYWRLRRRSQ